MDDHLSSLNIPYLMASTYPEHLESMLSQKVMLERKAVVAVYLIYELNKFEKMQLHQNQFCLKCWLYDLWNEKKGQKCMNIYHYQGFWFVTCSWGLPQCLQITDKSLFCFKEPFWEEHYCKSAGQQVFCTSWVNWNKYICTVCFHAYFLAYFYQATVL